MDKQIVGSIGYAPDYKSHDAGANLYAQLVAAQAELAQWHQLKALLEAQVVRIVPAHLNDYGICEQEAKLQCNKAWRTGKTLLNACDHINRLAPPLSEILARQPVLNMKDASVIRNRESAKYENEGKN